MLVPVMSHNILQPAWYFWLHTVSVFVSELQVGYTSSSPRYGSHLLLAERVKRLITKGEEEGEKCLKKIERNLMLVRIFWSK